MSVIVSANYRDRDQKNWLVRLTGAPLENYELRDRIVVKDFKFCDSEDGEDGFGCRFVATGELQETPEINRGELVRLKFNVTRFEEAESGKIVWDGAALVLDETGMYYLPA